MLVFHQQALVFLAVPKTATTALERAFDAQASLALRDPPGLKHMNALKFERVMRPLIETAGGQHFATVATMREPLDWLASWYRYRHRPHLAGTAKSTKGVSFEEFVQSYLNAESPHGDLGSQGAFLTDRRGRVRVDHLFDYARLSDLTAFLETHLGCRVELARCNVSPQISVDALSTETHARLKEALALDFRLYRHLSDSQTPLSMMKLRPPD